MKGPARPLSGNAFGRWPSYGPLKEADLPRCAGPKFLPRTNLSDPDVLHNCAERKQVRATRMRCHHDRLAGCFKLLAQHKTVFPFSKFGSLRWDGCFAHIFQVKYEEADSLLLRVLEILDATVGREHPTYASALHNRVGLLKLQVRATSRSSMFRAFDLWMLQCWRAIIAKQPVIVAEIFNTV